MLQETGQVRAWQTGPPTSGDHTVRLRIRRAVPEDIPNLERLVGRSVMGLQALDYGVRVLDSALHNGLPSPDRRLISDGTYYVAEVEGRIVGAGGWSRRRKIVNDAPGRADEDDLLDPATEAARIRAFYVHPGCARKGIGGRLLDTSGRPGEKVSCGWRSRYPTARLTRGSA